MEFKLLKCMSNFTQKQYYVCAWVNDSSFWVNLLMLLVKMTQDKFLLNIVSILLLAWLSKINRKWCLLLDVSICTQLFE
jgi:hypothetical protein